MSWAAFELLEMLGLLVPSRCCLRGIAVVFYHISMPISSYHIYNIYIYYVYLNFYLGTQEAIVQAYNFIRTILQICSEAPL